MNAGKGKDGKDTMPAMAVIPDFALEPLVAQTAPTTQSGRRERAIQFGFALLLNILFILALFYRPLYTLPPLSDERQAIEVELVQQEQAPPPPPPPAAEQPQQEQPPQPKVEEKPKEKSPEEYRESGGDPDLEIGNMPDKEAVPDKTETEVKAVKPEPEAKKQPPADLPDWVKSLDRGYDLPEPKASSSTRSRGQYTTNSPSGRIGQGGGDAYLNQVYAQIKAHVRAPASVVGRAGTAKVGFVLDRAGNLRSIYLVQSSGMREFDLEIMNAIRRAAPYRPLPMELGDNYALELRMSP